MNWSAHLGANIRPELRSIIAAIDHSSIIAITSDDGNITYVNDKFCEISKYTKEELIGKNHRILKSGHHPDRFYSDLWSTVASGQIWTGEIKNKARDGSFYWVFTTIVSFIRDNESFPQYVSIRFDISEKKLLEEKMNLLKIDLDQAMIEREMREQFLSTLSHDLKTPLTIAKFSAQIINKKYKVTNKVKNLTCKITDNINRVDTMITGLLDANRRRNLQNFPLEFVPFDMLDVVSESLENLATIHGNRFRLEAVGNLKGHWCLLGIKRILENLVTNAIKYGDADGAVVIKIKDNDSQVVLSVQNSGNPISEMDQRIIFDYLQRTSSAELSGQNGWGLGLTTVKAITEIHGGSVRVFSFEGIEGTTFTVTLPKDSRTFALKKAEKKINITIANEKENFLRLFRHMPEILVILSGPEHKFEFVNEAFIETFGINAKGKTVFEIGSSMADQLPIIDSVFSSGIPHKVRSNSMLINGKIRSFDQTWVPRKNKSGNIVGVLSISSEVLLES